MFRQRTICLGGLLAVVFSVVAPTAQAADGDCGCGCPATRCYKARKTAYLDGRARFGFFPTSWQKWHEQTIVADGSAPTAPPAVKSPVSTTGTPPSTLRAPVKLPPEKPESLSH